MISQIFRPMARWRVLLACLYLSGLASACAPTTRVILLPQADNTASSVVVRSSTTQVILDRPYQRASATGTDGLKGDTVSATDIQQKYLGLLTAVPKKPSKFMLNFLPGGTILSPESEAALPGIFAELADRAGADVVVIGHTDTTGTVASNDELSLKRAGMVADLLIDKGAPRTRVESVGRGKRALLIQTADDVDEPRNRRVEIVVR